MKFNHIATLTRNFQWLSTTFRIKSEVFHMEFKVILHVLASLFYHPPLHTLGEMVVSCSNPSLISLPKCNTINMTF